MSNDAFKARLAAERDAARSAALKELGVEKFDDAKSRIARAKELEDAQLSEAQRVQRQIEELKPFAERAKAYEASHAKIAERIEARVPEAKRSLLELAPADPVARAEWILNAEAKGLFADAAPAAAPPAAPREVRPATTLAPPGPVTPPPAGTLTVSQRYAQIKTQNPMLAAQYYAAHRRAIDAEASASR